MEEKEIIIDVTWKTAFNIYFKFFIINLGFVFIVWLLWTWANSEPSPQKTTSYTKSPTTYRNPTTSYSKTSNEDYEKCRAEKVNGSYMDLVECDKFLSPK